MRRTLAVARKEFLHIKRDPRSLGVAIVMPLIMVVLYGYAINMELKQLAVGVIDYDRSPDSRALIREMGSSRFIIPDQSLADRSEIEPGFRRGRFRAALIIPEGYARDLNSRPEAHIQIIVDGADGSTASIVETYLQAVVARVNRRLTSEALGIERFPIEPQTRILFNPQLVSANFVVPGLVAIVMIMVCALLTSIAIAREKETGTMEQILTTPVSPVEVIIGKVIPYLGIGALDGVLVLVAGYFIFGVPMNGSWWILAAYGLEYVTVALSLGLLISTVAKTQQVAMMAALMGTMLPAMMMSGFVFPIASMPTLLQWIAHLVPATYFLRIIRGVMLKGEAWFPFEAGVLALMAMLILTVAVKRFRGRVG